MSKSNIKDRCLSIINDLRSIEDILEFPSALIELDHLQNRLTDDEFRIAVVGEYSSGKSTFINALLGKDILTHATTETTATITQIINVAADNPLSYTGRVVLTNGEQFSLANFDALREYTTKASSNYDVVNEISVVELYLPVFPTDHRIVIIDTPGLNGIAEGHRERTVDLVQQAHACIYLLQLRGLSESDVSFVRYLSRYQKNFIFVQNFIDEFRRAEGDDITTKLAEQKKILDEQVFDENLNVTYSICGVSALMALTSFDESIPSLYEGGPLLTPEARKSLYTPSNFGQFKVILEDTFRPDKLDRLQYEDTAYALDAWLNGIIEQINRKETTLRDAYTKSQDRRSIEKLQRLKEKVISACTRQEEYLKNYITTNCEDIRKEEISWLKKRLEVIRDEIGIVINNFINADALENWSSNIAFELQRKIDSPIHQYLERYSLSLQALYQRLLCRIEEYSGINTDELTFDDIDIKPLSQPSYTYKNYENTIDELRRKVVAEKEHASALLSEKAKSDSQKRKVEEDLIGIKNSQSKLDSDKNASIAKLGTRPSIKETRKEWTDYEYRGVLGILDALLGPKKVKRSKIIKDDSAVKEWEAKKAKINNAYNEKLSELKRKLHAAERARDRHRTEVEGASKNYAEAQSRIASLEKQIKIEEDILQAKKTKAAMEFLAKFKRDLLKQVSSYLLEGDDSVLSKSDEELRAQMLSAETDFTVWAINLLKKTIDQKLIWIDQAIEKECPELLLKADQLATVNTQLKDMHHSLEALL